MTGDKLLLNIGVLIILMGIVWGAYWLGAVYPARKAKEALRHLEGPLGLVPASTLDSAWPGSREQFKWMAWPLSKGTRGEFRVEVSVQPPVRWHSTLTTVFVSGPYDARGRVFITRQPELRLFSKDALDPFAQMPPQTGTDVSSFLASARVSYEAEHLPRLLPETVRAELQGFPRRWMNVGVDGSAMVIAWWGVEQDPAIVERAFTIAMTNLRRLAEHSR